MSADLERIHARLDNVNAIAPLLGAQRTISLGSWQLALGKKQKLRTYLKYYSEILGYLSPILVHDFEAERAGEKPVSGKTISIIIGSEKGLCGGFNNSLINYTEQYLKESSESEHRVWVMGAKALQAVKRKSIMVDWFQSLPGKSYPPYEFSYRVVKKALNCYEMGQVDIVNVIFNEYRNSGSYRPKVIGLIPFSGENLAGVQDGKQNEDWPAPILDTDPQLIYLQIIENLSTMHLYEIFLDSAASEHSARFRLMEEATQNAERLVDELNLMAQTARRQAITREMQELAVGAGLTDD